MLARLLIVDDEKSIRELLRMALSKENYEIVEASNSVTALSYLEKENFDLVLLDWMLPDISGIQLLKKIRASHLDELHVIMISAKVQEQDRLMGFDCGVDDYIVKPFSVKEVVARVKAVLKRSSSIPKENLIECLGIALNISNQELKIDGVDVHLGPVELKLLIFLMTNPKRVFSRSQLIDRVWGVSTYVEERAVDVTIRRLRKALSIHKYEYLIQTVYGSGYRFNQDNNYGIYK